ncbi:RNA polymerase II holoenzyme cyclin-like subunit [Yarrowia lipolytica]|uniref:RNA polymerase II holoenzyme cyclin-like subunit n=2 Tax=Yarrowia lipolytica TaxID=4952 RepID=SSN8_YARLI|nr:YALI0D04004p [Yarrowia lipolytica CLIB122]Q6CAC7.1 RecName: Full=RNA polymerase II holoenzyme cyclin-like subunit [Yarrowia lipolytica CLIB122]AOW03551.1 hypothetical protein YALI1_D05019g [Yarrowia lipolytica]KAB8284678.1 RNA polymerase II holoenzyme cyclin-like subunit [Yarrowia lipolytica]KAE8171303.1 RNA polymerase II holoenzyme cyclin-like subunit [Yarrowia lipolytica]KAJ8054821.1 RNA polymerase II holoenzyme cyclin-like subunit [Yarrowia lipolytica]QNP98609.1 RNA polymerase II holoen|eukprot:XP_502385.1 YALI0D04004p [Yarrowia lipolytica CLIB122]
MSANYWTSSQRLHWLLTKETLAERRKGLEDIFDPGKLQTIKALNPWHVRVYLHTLIHLLGQNLSIRQRILATAEVYLTRFHTKVPFGEINPYLVVATAVYVACKVEEHPQHIRTITSEARSLWPDYISHDPTKIAECEFYLIEELGTYLVIFHPYKSLMQISDAMARSNAQITMAPEEIQVTWSMINDSYITDLHLLNPPHIVAMACIYMTVVLRSHIMRMTMPSEAVKSRIEAFMTFFGESNVDLEQTIDCVQEMISLYVNWDTYSEKQCRVEIAKVIT